MSGILADLLRAFAHLGITEIGEIDVVDLQIGAAGLGELCDLFAKHSRQVGKEFFHVGIRRLVHAAAAGAKMHQRRRRDALLGGLLGHRREKLKIFHLDAARMTEFPGYDELGRRTLHVRARILKMLGGVRQQSFDDFHAGDLTEKIRVP